MKCTATKPKKLPPILPGETLLEDFMKPLRINANRVAIELRVPAQQISEIIEGQRGITAPTALRLARYFNTSGQFWMNLQSHYELQVASDIGGPNQLRLMAKFKNDKTAIPRP